MGRGLWALLFASCAVAPAPVVAPQPNPGLTLDERIALDLELLAEHCADRSDACAAHAQPDLYPDVEVPESTARMIDSTEQEVRTLGLALRWDPGSGRYEIDRGNTPTWNGP